MTATPALSGPVPPVERPAHRDPDVLRWLGAYASSAIGDNIYYVALSWAAVQAGTPSQAGLVMAVSAVPRALLMLGGGVVADRFGPRRVLILSDTVRCAAVTAVAVLLLVTSPGLWPLGLLALVFGAVDAVLMPALGALPARITSRGQLARVQGMRGMAHRLANVAGAPLGGLGVALGGAAAAFGTAALLFAVSLPLLMAVRTGPRPLPRERPTGRPGPPDHTPPAGHGRAAGAGTREAPAGREPSGGAADQGVTAGPESSGGPGDPGVPAGRGSSGGSGGRRAAAGTEPSGGAGVSARGVAWRELRDGLDHIRRNPVLARLMTVIALSDLGFVGPLNVGLTLLADERGWGAPGMGWVLAGFGTGAGAMSLLLTVRGRVPRAGLVLSVSIAVAAVAVGGLAYVPTLTAAVGAALAVGLLAGLSGTVCGALVQTESDPAYVGRVTSVASLFSLGLAPLTFPVTGAAIALWGTGPVFAASAGVCVLGGVLGLGSRALRHAELPR